MSRVGIFVSTEAEAITIRNSYVNVNVSNSYVVCVVKYPVYWIYDKKKNEYADATQDDFKTKQAKLVEDFLFDNNCDSLVALAAADHDGMLWLAHMYHFSVMHEYEIQFMTYSHIGNCADSTNVSAHQLSKVYEVFVFNTLISYRYHKLLAKPIAKKVFGKSSSALSLGALRALMCFGGFTNPRVFLATIASRDSSGNVIGSYIADPYEAPPVEDVLLPGSLTVESNNKDIFDPYVNLADADTDAAGRDPAIAFSSLWGAVDPYITCLLMNIPLRAYKAMVHDGTFTVAVPPSISVHDNSAALALKARLNSLQVANVIEMESPVFTDSHVHHTCAVGNYIGNDTDSALLYDRYFTRTLLQSIPFPSFTRSSNLRIECNYETVNSLTHRHIPVVLSEDTVSHGWLRLIDNSKILIMPESVPRESRPYEYEVGDSPRFLANIYESLNKYFGHRYSYTHTLIKWLESRGFVELSSTGARITSYGYGVLCEHLNHLSASIPSGADEPQESYAHTLFDDACLLVNASLDSNNEDADYAAHSLPAVKGKMRGELEAIMEDAFGHLEALAKHLPSVKTITCVVKSKSSKHVKYRLAFDHDKRLAMFTTRGKKPRAVFAKYTQTACQVNLSDTSGTFHDFNVFASRPIPLPSSYLKSRYFTTPCPECGRHTAGISVEHCSIKYKCDCGHTSQAPFIIHER